MGSDVMTYKLLAAAINHPDPINPYFGLFNARSIESLAKKNIEVDVVTPRPFAPPIGPYSEYKEIPRISTHNGYRVHHPRFFYGVPKRIFYGLSGDSYAKRIPSYINKLFEVPDVVHAYHIYPDGYGMIPYCREHDLPLFVVAHGSALNNFNDHSESVRLKIKDALEFSDMVICVSEALAEKAKKITQEIETEVIPIGADPTSYPLKEEHKLRTQKGIPDDRPVVFFCGQYVERKGIKDIIEVLPGLGGLESHFVFAGQDGPMREPLEDAIQTNGLHERFEVEYDVPNATIREFFAIADIFLLPSHSEGRPTVIYEAMASETAVIATNVGGIPEQISNEENGILIPAREPGRILSSVNRLVSNPEYMATLGKTGKEMLMNKGWTWDGHADRLQNLHSSFIKGDK